MQTKISTSTTGTGSISGHSDLYHSIASDAVLERFKSTADGLSSSEAQERLAEYGPNILPKAKGDGPLQLLWRQINNPLIWVLIASGGIAMVVDPQDGIKNGLVILAVVALNTLIGFVQEFKAGKAIEALSQMVPENVTAFRDNKKVTLSASELVPGDVVTLASGDKVPADMRLFQLRNLRIEEAALTGESVPTEKSLAPVSADAILGDRTNMTFGGTLVTYGTGTAVVVGTGAKTELGKISAMLRETTDLATPLTKALGTIGKYITIAIIIISIVMLIIGTVRTEFATQQGWMTSFQETVIFAIALAVGAIPEGLPAIVTIALAIGVQRMASRRAVVRKLPAVETLGSTTVICSDKTGTLTRNEMTVQSVWTPHSGSMNITGVGYEPAGQLRHPSNSESQSPSGSLLDLLAAGAICNDSVLEQKQGRWTITGDPTEGALVVSAEKLSIPVEDLRKRHKRIDTIPFESENQFMATLNIESAAQAIIYMKGAPEVVLSRCSNIPDLQVVFAEIDRLAALGMRVLGIASKPAPNKSALHIPDVETDMTFLGLQGMIDPPRTEVIEAIKVCHKAGITVKMITGDHKLTAHAIGQQINIATPEMKPITGVQLAEMTDAQMQTAIFTTNVFARVAPEHKLRLVRALQARGEVVAMTGDGVNDAPALKQANIGVAMGITGTSVSKEASSVVLADDNFASIAAAVEEGRRVYDNLIKSLAFVLPTNLGLAMILMAAVAFFPFETLASGATELLLPMLPTQLLWINLVATVALALPLAFEAKEPNIMNRPPRKPDAPVLSSFVIMRTFVAAFLMTVACIGLFLHAYNLTGDLARAQTMGVTTVIMFQIFYMINCRSLRDSVLRIGLFSNPTIFVGIVALLILQLAFIYLPVMQTIFNTAPLSGSDLLLSIVAGMIILPVISFEKWWRNRPAT